MGPSSTSTVIAAPGRNPLHHRHWPIGASTPTPLHALDIPLRESDTRPVLHHAKFVDIVTSHISQRARHDHNHCPPGRPTPSAAR